jgi:hypothetical protein
VTREEAIERLEDTFEAWESWDCPEHSPMAQMNKALSMAISALREQPRWISVEEKLPEHGQKVLSIDSDGEIEVWCFDAEYPSMCRYGGNLRAFDISHWMQLPSAPTEEEV